MPAASLELPVAPRNRSVFVTLQDLVFTNEEMPDGAMLIGIRERVYVSANVLPTSTIHTTITNTNTTTCTSVQGH